MIWGIPKIAGQSAGSVLWLLGITHEASFCHSAYQHFPLHAGYSDIPSKDNTTIFSSVSGIQSGLPFTTGCFKVNFFRYISFTTDYTYGFTHTVKAYCTAKESYLTSLISFDWRANTVDDLFKNTALYKVHV